MARKLKKIILDLKRHDDYTLFVATQYATAFMKTFPKSFGPKKGRIYDSRFMVYQTAKEVFVTDNGLIGDTESRNENGDTENEIAYSTRPGVWDDDVWIADDEIIG